ncbi:MAG: hypothetical protein KatS3mg003_1652 [Candidatus Nitrosocaldaceae archaeon]|nr:MAG: hypothetical protein KatS3mg003_1652 [Candidatus Nitrosocaldaceae archaeon]
MNPTIILKIIDSLTNNKIMNDKVSEDILNVFNNIGIEISDERNIQFNREDRLKLAIIALKNGVDIKEVAKVLSWKDFEYFASIILNEHNYQVYNSVRIKRLEIDILAIDDLALVIDCKHWKYNNNSMLKKAVEKQIRRIELLLNSNRFDISYAVPIILTLHESISFIDKVPIVPITKFDSFIGEFKGYLDHICIIKR